MEVKNFDIEFVERTKRLLEDYDGSLDFSNLLNCTLGLIILPFEKGQGGSIFGTTDLTTIQTQIGFNLHKFNPIKSKNKNTTQYHTADLDKFLRKLRHGLAHQHIKPINKSGKWVGVKIWNEWMDPPPKEVDLEVDFTKEQFRKFAIFIAELYLSQKT